MRTKEIRVVIEGPEALMPAVLLCNQLSPDGHAIPKVLSETAVYVRPVYGSTPKLVSGKRREESLLEIAKKHLKESHGCQMDSILLFIDNLGNSPAMFRFQTLE